MTAKTGRRIIGRDAVRQKGWLRASKWLIARRSTQIGILALFMLGPVAGVWIVKGNLNSSLTLGVLPLTDPYVLLQSLLARHWPELSAIIGAVIVAAFYAAIGGRVYCSWVCPVNMVTDAARWLRARVGLTGASRLPRSTRYALLAGSLLASAVAGTLAWESINPVSMVHRGLFFGIGLAWLVVLAIFVLDAFISPRSWCGHLCPVGAFYALLGRHSLVRVGAPARDRCNDCGDCYAVCPEPHVLRPALEGRANGSLQTIVSPECTNCGRCIDVCSKDVFTFTTRLHSGGNAVAPLPAGTSGGNGSIQSQ